MIKVLVLYDNTGSIWGSVYGEEKAPQEIKAKIFEIPENVMSIDHVDLTDPAGPSLDVTFYPQSDTGIEIEKEKEKRIAAENKAENMRSAAELLTTKVSDEIILVMHNLAPDIFDVWEPGKWLDAGKLITYDGVLYRVLQGHNTAEEWQPNYTASLYAKVLSGASGDVTEWEQPDSTNGYMMGDRVRHNGIVYLSMVDNNVWEPGDDTTGSLWSIVD